MRTRVNFAIIVFFMALISHISISTAKRSSNVCKTSTDRAAIKKEANRLDSVNDFRGALKCHERALQVATSDKERAESWMDVGIMFYAMQNAQQSLAAFQKAHDLAPENAEYLSAMGNAQNAMGKFDAAIDSFDAALKIRPDSLAFLYNKATSFRTGRRIPEAIAAMEDLLARRGNDSPGQDVFQGMAFATALEGYGNNLRVVGRYDEAVKALEEAISILPQSSEFENTLGCIYIMKEDYEKARIHLKRSIKLNPKRPDPYLNMANTYSLAKDYFPSLQWYEKTIARDKEPVAAHLGSYLYSKQCVCHWDNYQEKFEELRRAVKLFRKNRDDRSKDTNPFRPDDMTFGALESLTMPFNGRETAQIAKDTALNHYAKHPYTRKAKPMKAPKLLSAETSIGRPRLRIAYISANFGYHVASSTIQGVFKAHDRSKFEVTLIALNADDGSPLRQAFRDDPDHFIDLSSTPLHDQIATIRDGQYHILIDIDGYTSGTRREIFMSQVAPLQVLLMGYVGTIGDAKSVHYNVGDPVVSPPQLAPYFTEKLIYLPHSYFVNDHDSMYREYVSEIDTMDIPATRRAIGLPVDNIVFCNFNRHRKFDAQSFKAWMRILQAVPDSVMWMLAFDAGQERLIAEADAIGVDRSRLIFSQRWPLNRHLQHKTACDIFLDTPVYNSHTTGLDILYAGVPMVSFMLDRMSSRVSGSLVTAIGAPDLVARTWDEYTDLAVELAANKEKREALRAAIRKNRRSYPLFDLARWIHNYESALQQMWTVYDISKGKKMHQIVSDHAPMGRRWQRES